MSSLPIIAATSNGLPPGTPADPAWYIGPAKRSTTPSMILTSISSLSNSSFTTLSNPLAAAQISGALFERSRKFTSTFPVLKSSLTTSACPPLAAQRSGVSPAAFTTSGSAPASTRYPTRDACPPKAAKCTAVSPCRTIRVFILTPLSTRNRTLSPCPPNAAAIRGR